MAAELAEAPGLGHLRLGAGLGVAVLVGIAVDAERVGDVEGAVAERHAMGPFEPFGIGLAHLGLAVVIGVAKHRDLAAPRSLRAAALTVGLGQEDVAVRGDREPARAGQTIGEDAWPGSPAEPAAWPPADAAPVVERRAVAGVA